MYKKFFGLVKNPFNVTPDPYFLFSTAETDKTYASLLYGIRARKGLILLVGEVGTGKTLLLRKLVEELHDEATATAFVFNPRMRAAEFLDYVLSDFGLEHDSNDRLRRFKALQDWLLGHYRMGQTSVLIIDEAQDVSREVFEVVRALSNLEVPTEKLLQIILSGQPEIEEKLRQPELRPVTQSIALWLRTCPLGPAETLQYIAHRLRVAGGDVETVFTPEAIKAVYWSSAGIPRLINLICEHALISGYTEQWKPVGAETIWEIAQEYALGVAPLGEEALADEVLGPLETGALTQQITEITNLAGPPAQPAPKHVSPESHEIPLPIGAQTYAGTCAEAALTPQGGESVKSVAPRAPVPTETPPRVPEVISQPNEEQVAERVAVQPLPAIQPAEVPKSWGPQIPTATQAPSAMPRVTVTAPGASNPAGEFTGAQSAGGQGPKESPAGRPVIAAKSPAGAQGSAGGTIVAPREALQPLLLKKGAARPALANIHLPPKPARGRSGALQWASLALITIGVVLGGYYIIGRGWLMRTKQGRAASSRSQSLTLENQPRHTLATPQTSAPSGRTGVTGQEQAPTQPATSVPSGKAGQVTAIPAKEGLPSRPPRVLARVAPESPKVQDPGKLATALTRVPSPPPASGQLVVMSNVSGATITVDGRSDPNWTTPHTFADLSPGSHNIVVSKQGYKEAQQNVRLEAGGEVSVDATLNPPRGEIDISTSPPGAEVLIDGKSYGPGPVRAEVDAGQHSFLVKQAGRESVAGKLMVQDQAVVQRTIDLPLEAPKPPTMNVAVTTSPPVATVYADGAPMGGKTPTSFHLSPGHHILIIFAAGYRPVRREIDVPEDGALTVNATLSGQ